MPIEKAPARQNASASQGVAGALLIVSGVNLVSLSVGVQVMNALLLPIVLGFLYLLARRLPPPNRLDGAYVVVMAVIITAAVNFGVYAGIAGLGLSKVCGPAWRSEDMRAS